MRARTDFSRKYAPKYREFSQGRCDTNGSWNTYICHNADAHVTTSHVFNERSRLCCIKRIHNTCTPCVFKLHSSIMAGNQPNTERRELFSVWKAGEVGHQMCGCWSLLPLNMYTALRHLLLHIDFGSVDTTRHTTTPSGHLSPTAMQQCHMQRDTWWKLPLEVTASDGNAFRAIYWEQCVKED